MLLEALKEKYPESQLASHFVPSSWMYLASVGHEETHWVKVELVNWSSASSHSGAHVRKASDAWACFRNGQKLESLGVSQMVFPLTRVAFRYPHEERQF